MDKDNSNKPLVIKVSVKQKKPLVIRVSFTEEQETLYNSIINECAIIGKSAWMKMAATEKLGRDKNSKSEVNNVAMPRRENNNPVIQSLDQLFKV